MINLKNKWKYKAIKTVPDITEKNLKVNKN